MCVSLEGLSTKVERPQKQPNRTVRIPSYDRDIGLPNRFTFFHHGFHLSSSTQLCEDLQKRGSYERSDVSDGVETKEFFFGRHEGHKSQSKSSGDEKLSTIRIMDRAVMWMIVTRGVGVRGSFSPWGSLARAGFLKYRSTVLWEGKSWAWSVTRSRQKSSDRGG